MLAHFYNTDGIYVTSCPAQLDPEGTCLGEYPAYLVPAGATLAELPLTGENEVAVWNGQEWEIKPDFRGETVYDTATGNAIIILNIGPLPDNVTPQQPPEKLKQYYRWNGVTWAPSEAKRGELLKLAGDKIDAQTAALLAAGFEFDDVKFPLYGNLYAQNMAAASAYAFRGTSAGRNLYTLDGGFILVTDIAGLIAAGDDMATGICMDAVEQKNTLSGKTAAELIQFINANQ